MKSARLVDAALTIERRCLELRIEARRGAHRRHGFFPRRDPFTSESGVEPCAGIELFDLGEREVDGQPLLPASCLIDGRPIGKHLFDVRRPLERLVMQAHEHEVFGDCQILLDVVGVLLQREPIGGQRVFRRVGGCAAMRHQFLRGDRA